MTVPLFMGWVCDVHIGRSRYTSVSGRPAVVKAVADDVIEGRGG